ncbi:MAG: tRNA epoxyqueuosine(34) reductase QueG, partial [Chloroflexi bacterium]|nr:tRNA epoxyqueuosine(34) reductase QueG [Chloroflexota bacterium]
MAIPVVRLSRSEASPFCAAVNQVGNVSLADVIRELALAEGFGEVGITTADPFPQIEAVVVERIGAGYLDGMPWFSADRARLAARPRDLLPWARSIICLASSYYAEGVADATAPGRPHGQVARYAWGPDYHDVLRAKMVRLVERLRGRAGVPVGARLFVDTGRLIERAAAQRSGIGWFGKSSNLITRRHGSWVFLAEIVTDLELPPDRPAAGHCGTCDRCLPACPTGAIVGPGVVDSRRCIAYLTIEHCGSIPRDLRPLLGNRIFGCDVCQ